MAEVSGSSGIGATLSSIQNVANAVREQQLRASSGSNLQMPAVEIKEYQKEVRKSPFTTAGAATDMGLLVKGTNRLNVISNLKAKDTVDFYKFRVVNQGEVTLGQAGGEGLRVQVMSKLGTVIADSNEKTGKQNENFKKFQDGTMTLERGDYVLRVTRDEQVKKTDVNYALQLRMGRFVNDYDTIVREPQAGDGVPAQSEAMGKLLDMMSTSTSAMNNLAPIGTTGTQKLMGTLFSGTF